MTTKSQRPKGRDGALSSLNMAIDTLNLAKEATSATQVKTAFESARDLLTMIRDSLIKKADYVELGLACADVCEALDRGMDGRRADQLSRPIVDTIEKLKITVAEIQKHIVERGRRNAISRRFHAKDDKEAITAWRVDLDRILRVFDAELGENADVTASDVYRDAVNRRIVISDVHRDTSNAKTIAPNVRHGVSNIHPIVSNVHQNKLKGHENVGGQNRATHASAPGESPPPQPRNTQGTASDVRREVSAVHRDLVNTQTVVFDIHRNILKGQEEAGGQNRLTQISIPGESPPPAPRAFFGRDELIKKLAGLAQNLTPIALIGAGGIGKTSIALTVLHNDRVKQKFGGNRRFIRCDHFPASLNHFLRRLSKAIGAGIENPEDLAPLRSFLFSKEMFIVLDNAESILDPHGANAQEIYTVVEELSQLGNVCLCITSRVSTIPPDCEWVDVPTLSVEAGRDTFYRIYKHGEQSDPVNDVLGQLDFHPLSITLLATVAQHNRWDTNRLIREWEKQRTGVLHVQQSRSLATAIELSLASPMFRELGPDARELLGAIAFFPQGVNEENVGWLFPTITGGLNIFDKFCVLSLTYRSNGFITMLEPLRDYLRPKDPASTPLLGMTKEHYFTRLSASLHPDKPGFEEGRWILSEDVNVEYLLDIFTSVDPNSETIWDACAKFMDYLYWYKPRLVMFGPKIESLPDDHPSKAQCLEGLTWLFALVGNQTKRKRILTHTLKFWRERGDDYRVALTLNYLSDANRHISLYDEGIQQAKEASGIFERLGETVQQAGCLGDLSWLLYADKQLDAAEEVAFRVIDLLPGGSPKSHICKTHRVLGKIYHSKDETKKAIHHFEVALGIASSSGYHSDLFWIHFSLAEVFSREGKYDDGHANIELARSHAVNNAYLLACASQLQAEVWDMQGVFEEAKSEALRAAEVFEKLGAARDAEETRKLLRRIDRDARGSGTPDGSGDDR